MSDTGQPSTNELDSFQRRLGHSFADHDLLLRALTHPSFANEVPGAVDNQRMEYLGDSVLNLSISTELFHRFPGRSEGQLSRLRSSLVREATLAQRATELNLGQCLRLGRGERLSGGREKHSLLADAYEAVLAAVYLDSNFETANRVILTAFADALDAIADGRHARDHKTRLQEIIQSQSDQRPRYIITDIDGPPHARRFTAEVRVGDELLGQGQGMSKKAAQQDAARAALEAIQTAERSGPAP